VARKGMQARDKTVNTCVIMCGIRGAVRKSFPYQFPGRVPPN